MEKKLCPYCKGTGEIRRTERELRGLVECVPIYFWEDYYEICPYCEGRDEELREEKETEELEEETREEEICKTCKDKGEITIHPTTTWHPRIHPKPKQISCPNCKGIGKISK